MIDITVKLAQMTAWESMELREYDEPQKKGGRGEVKYKTKLWT